MYRLHNIKIFCFLPDDLLFIISGVLTLREERRLRVFENKILRRVFRPRRDVNVQMVSEEDSTMRNFIICTVHLI